MSGAAIKVGYVGLGVMGGALARRLMLSRPMTVYDLRPELMRAFVAEGAEAAADLPTLAHACDVIMICVPTSADVRTSIFGPGGLAEGLSPGKIIVDQTTGDPVQTRAIAADLTRLGVAMVDAPVSGGPRGAAAGTIAIMCGGPEDALATVRVILDEISPNIVHCGEVGHGNVAKLVNNTVAACNRLITLEAATMGFTYGLALDDMAQVINAGTGWNAASERILPVLGTGERTADFRLELMVKDLRLASRMGMVCGAPMLVANMVRSMFETGMNELGSDAQIDDMAKLFEAMAGVTFMR